MSLTRRTFLVSGSATAAALALGVRPADAAGANRSAVFAGRDGSTSVGYIAPVDGAAVTAGRHRVVPADRIAPDRSLHGPVRVGVRGLVGVRGAVPVVRVDAEWPDPASETETLPFHVWQTGSQSVVYTVHVGDGIEPAFTVESANGRTSTRFSVSNDPSVPGLREGTYLLGLAPGAWRRPKTVDLADSTGALPASLLVTVMSGQPNAAS